VNKALTVVGMAILVAACSANSSELGLPSASMPTNLTSTATGSDDAYFIVNVWGVPLIVSADFIPG
jgi:hypothetical protein